MLGARPWPLCPGVTHFGRDPEVGGIPHGWSWGAQRGTDVLHSFPIALIRNAVPQDRLWPGSEPNVNILAEPVRFIQ